MKKFLLSIAMVLAWFGVANATTYDLSAWGNNTCNNTNVQNAIDAASDGDTIYMNCATGSWTGNITINSKGLTLKGRSADYLNGSSATVITTSGNMEITGSASHRFITDGPSIILRDFKIIGSEEIIWLNGLHWVIQNVWFSHSSGYCLHTSGYNIGVISGCRIISTYTGLYVQEGNSAAAFARDTSIGTGNSVFMEGCILQGPSSHSQDHVIWAQEGEGYVLRYNTITNWQADFHGPCTSGGAREFEIYNNAWTGASLNFALMQIRGGSGVAYNNTGPGPYGWGLWMQEVCDSPAMCACPDPSYPITHQLGRGKADVLEPIGFWNNKIDGSYWVTNPAIPECLKSPFNNCSSYSIWANGPDSGGCSGVQDAGYYTQLNRDFYDSETKPAYFASYTPYTCPHPLATQAAGTYGLCTESIIGVTGYSLTGGSTPPSATGCTIQGGSFK